MARINIEDTLFKYGPFTKLMIKMGSRRVALGAFVEAVIVAQKYWVQGKNPIPMPVFKREELADELIDTGMAELINEGESVKLRGSEEQFAWLVACSENGKKGGPAAAKSRRENIGEINRPPLSVGNPESSENVNSRPLALPLAPSLPLSLSSNSISDSTGSQSASASEPETLPVVSPKKPKVTNPLNADTWDAYQEVYRGRYRQDPTRNASVNAMISNFVKRIGEDAPHVAAFYVRHNKAYYVQNLHQVKHMLSDAEALHTQWKNGQQVLSTTGREVERMQHNHDVWGGAAARIAARKEQQNG